MTQPDLIDLMTRPNFRNRDPETSCQAGCKAREFMGEHHAAILGVLRLHGRPMAPKEIADALGWPSHHAVNRRTAELECNGLIEVAEGVLFTNPSGRKARCYRLRSSP